MRKFVPKNSKLNNANLLLTSLKIKVQGRECNSFNNIFIKLVKGPRAISCNN